MRTQPCVAVLKALIAAALLAGCATAPLPPSPAPNTWIETWQGIGPFPVTEESNHTTDWLGGEAAFSEPGALLPGRYRDQILPHPISPTESGLVDLGDALGPSERCVAYAWTEFESPHGGAAALRMGSDDGITVWVNGQEVWNHRVFRGAMPDQDLTIVPLREGRNRLLVKVEQGEGDWGFYLRLGEIVPATEGMHLQPLVPVVAPVLLTGGSLPPQQSLDITLANFGQGTATDLRIRCRSTLLEETLSDPFSCESLDVVEISVPLRSHPGIAPGAAGVITVEAIAPSGESMPVAEVPVVTGAIHPLLGNASARAERPFTVVQLSDTHIRERDSDMLGVRTADRLLEAIAEINAMDPRPAFVVVTGDFTHDSIDAYPVYADLMSRLEVPHLTVFGNHDKVQSLAASARALSEWGQPPHSAFEMGGVLFVCLDTMNSNDPSAKGEISAAQREWLAELLADHPGMPRVFFLHHDLHTGLGVGDIEEVQVTLDSDPEEQWFFSGHWHADSFARRGDQRHIVTTSIGYLFDDGSLHFSHQVPGYRLIHIDEDRIWTEFKPLGGEALADPDFEDYDTVEDVLRALGRLEE